jgi:hypothetical protein
VGAARCGELEKMMRAGRVVCAIAAFVLLAPTSVFAAPKGAIHKKLTSKAKKNRKVWLRETKGKNLAAGKTVTFSSPPNYKLTSDAKDALDLTDGILSQRDDDRMWFEKSAVGWAYAQTVTMMVDLGSVQPIQKVALRALGGAEQGSLLFPKSIRLVVSEDGETFYRVDVLAKLAPGEKGMAGNPGVFYLAEEGKAYAYPIAFSNLKTKARYIGLEIAPDRAFFFLDELVVLKGKHDVRKVEYAAKDEELFLIRGLALQPRNQQFVISTNIATPNRFFLTDARDPKDRKKPITFVIEVPAEVSVAKNSRAFTLNEETFKAGGRRMRRLTLTKCSLRRGTIGPFYFNVSKPKAIKGAKATFYAVVSGYKTIKTTVPLETVEIPRIKRFKQHDISLAWMADSENQYWPDFFTAWDQMGFNCVATFPRYWKNTVTPERAKFLAEARKRGMKVIYNESPFHMMVRKYKKEEEIYSQVTIKGKPSKDPCPSYRGQFYQAEIKRVGDCFELVKPDYVFYDIELWSLGARLANRCTRCKKARAKTGKGLDDWRTDQGVEMIADMENEIRKRAKKLDMPMPQISIYNVQAARPLYHHTFDFNKLYPKHLYAAQPSLYVKGDGLTVHNSISKNYGLIGKRDVMPWLSTGTYGEFDPAKVEHMILESFLNGASGLTYYCFSDFDTPMDFYYHAKALKHLQPYEELLSKGKPVKVKSDNSMITCSAYRFGGAMLLLAANYQRSSKTAVSITLPYKKVDKVLDVRNDKAMPKATSLKLTIPPGEIALIYISGE